MARESGGKALREDAKSTTSVVPDAEVRDRPTRRRFSPEYKLRILREVEGCSGPGEIGALLRREGLYSSLLSTWRKQRDQGALESLQVRKRGPKVDEAKRERREIERLERENQRLRLRLEQARKIIELQKKVSDLLGIEQPESANLEIEE
jgi:transposase